MSILNSRKIRTVSMNARGQIVIPEDIRRDLGITGESTLVLIQKGSEIILKTDAEVLEALESEDRFWRAMTVESMQRAWEKEDEIWDDLYDKANT